MTLLQSLRKLSQTFPKPNPRSPSHPPGSYEPEGHPEAIFASSAERLKAFCKGLLRLSRGVLGSLKVFGRPTRFGAPRGSLGALPRGVFAAPSKPLGAFIKALFAPVKTFLSLSLSVFLAAKFRPQILTPKATKKGCKNTKQKKKP